MWNDQFSLYPYQEKASETMAGSNVLLAYEMGLGKTPTTIHAIETMRQDRAVVGPGTVVAPASLKWQWKREVEKFSDQTAIVIDGPPKTREKQYLRIISEGHNYVVMSYDTFIRDWEHHYAVADSFLVADEATALKTWSSKRSQFFKKVRENYPIRLALTGTPVENGKAEEVFSIMEWVDPAVLGPFWRFEEKHVRRNQYGWIEGYKNLDSFHKTLKPYVLRATHKQPEVAKYLPKVMHRDPEMVPMSRGLSKAVHWISDLLLSDLDALVDQMAVKWDALSNDGYDESHPDGMMMAKIQVMRMLLDHPDAVLASAQDFLDPSTPTGSKFSSEIVAAGLLERVGTPKLDALEKYVDDFLDLDPRNKVVIFTSFVHVCERISQRLKQHGPETFTGSMSPAARDRAKQRFSVHPDCRVFVSTDAGGYGLDLPVANLLINFDLPWQAGLLKQRNARIRRASSTWPYVVVQDFIVEGSIEERMRAMLDHKIAIGDAIVDGEGITESGGVATDLDSLRSFLTDLLGSELISA
jgi:SNF2 family DNA or RNA helicase